MPGLILAAPSSGSGKTTVTLGLLRALRNRGIAVRGAKSGPDYIDPRFHEAACEQPCFNLDAWAMAPDRIRTLAATDDLLLIEGAMGLFDGAPPDGRGSTADLARILGLPVILIIDAARMSQSITPLVRGFRDHDPKVKISGILLNRVGSERHERLLKTALEPLGLPIIGALPRQDYLTHPSRHLGLVQASERPDLDDFLDRVANAIEAACDIDTLCAQAVGLNSAPNARAMSPPAQTIAIAQDEAFAFTYPHLLADWRAAGATLRFFSPLADEAAPDADLIFLPGGYPELHAGRLSANTIFMQSLRKAAETADIYGECGGYMVLGEAITDADGHCHPMADLLPLHTSFADRKLHLGYRSLAPLGGPFKGSLNGHEFHYATTIRAEGPTLFQARDAEGQSLPDMGLRQGRVCGSFAHIIDTAD